MTGAPRDVAPRTAAATRPRLVDGASPDRGEALGAARPDDRPMPKARVALMPRAAVSAAAALLLATLALAACGESAQDKARAQVCDARKAISAEVTKLQGLTLSSNTVDEVKTGVESIGAELRKIRDAQPDLAPSRKQEVETATSKFGDQLEAIGLQLARSLTSGTAEGATERARTQVKAAIEALASDYRKTLGPISC